MNDAALSIDEANAQLTAPGQIFETERIDVNGVVLTTWKHAPPTLRHLLELSLNHAQRDFLVYEDQRYTFDEHYRVVATIAAWLRERGAAKGDHVAIASRNLPEWVIAFWASIVTGAVVVPLNAWWTTAELHYGLLDSGTSILFVDEERLERIRPLFERLPELTTVVVMSEDHARVPHLGDAHPRVRVFAFDDLRDDLDADANLPDVALAADDDATMLYTSGTTGRPKGAVSSHRNIVTNVMNLFFGAQRAALRYGSDTSETPNVQSSGLLNIPFFHATGCYAFMIPATAAGSKIVMMHHFDAKEALRVIEQERITGIGGVPTIAMQILDDPDFSKFDTSSITNISYGGAPAPPDLEKRIRAAFPGGQAGNGYGLTETSASVCGNSGPDYAARPTSCGPAYPVNEVVVVPEGFRGEEPSDDLPKGPEVVGELWIKGPNVVRGYWNKPDETAQTFTRGWLHTGDIARIDDEGFVYIVDRAKDMIIRGGENVYSVIVEGAIFEHPDVADCAVVGLPHATLGEEVTAIIVLRPGRVIEADEIARHVGLRLARFEVPTKIVFRASALPRNPQGKVLKRELRDALIEVANSR